jgi:hypothetical protein
MPGRSSAERAATIGVRTGQEPLLPPFAEHGGGASRGLERVDEATDDRGRFGRLFPDLPPFLPKPATLEALAASMFPGPPAPAPGPSPGPSTAFGPRSPAPVAALEPGENPDIPAGYTYLGQFVDHDVTYDPLSSLQRQNDPAALRSFRTPRFDLDPLYASGPIPSAYLYDQTDPVKLLVGRNTGRALEPEDLPRNFQGRAVVPDPRNDVHFILTHLHLAFVRFHNAVVDHLRAQQPPPTDLFTEAQRLTRWHYQWVVVEEYLRKLVAPDVLDDVLHVDARTGARSVRTRFYRWVGQPFIPVEFSVAAFRFGHSQVRARYFLNSRMQPLHILLPSADADPLLHLGGFRPLPRGFAIDWSLFFPIGGSTPQLSRRIDTNLAGPFVQLPVFVDAQQRSLALLNLLRGRALGLPAGQAVAEAMGTSRSNRELGLPAGKTPLWFWLLKESEVVEEGKRLGPTSGRIVAEVLLGMLAGDPSSFLHASPPWTPTLPAAQPGQFTIVDLLRFAGAA